MGNNQNGIAIYSRKSKFTGKGESIGNQIELCRDYIRTMFGEACLRDITVFEDEGFSGGNLKRPDFQKMMDSVRKRRFRAIVVYRLDRISRNISDFTNLIDELTKLGVSFVSIREQFDTSTPMGRAMMFIISVFSQLERETIAERIRDNMHELAKTGRWLGGNTPTGFASESVTTVTVDGKARKACRLKLIPEEAEVVKTIFDIYARTDSLTATDSELLYRKVKTKAGNNFSRFSIKGILQNPVYMIADEDAYNYFAEQNVEVFAQKAEFDGKHGIMAYNRTEQEKGHTTTYLPMQEWIVAVGQHLGLIHAKQWIDIQRSLERNKDKSYRKPRRNEAVLTGRIFCCCGEKMFPKLTQRKTADGHQAYSYRCKMKERSKGERCKCRDVNGNRLDAFVMEHIKMLSEDTYSFLTQLEKARGLLRSDGAQGATQLAELRAEYSENRKKIKSLVDTMAVLEASSARMHIAAGIEQLHERNCSVESRIQELEALSSANELKDTEFDVLRRCLSQFQASADRMSVEEKREMVRALVAKVIWDGGNAHVVLSGAEEDAPDFFLRE